MIRLKKDGKYFDVEPGEKITIEWVSTVFNAEDDLKGSYSYQVKAPFTPTNDLLLKFGRMLENRSARMETVATIEIFGQDWKQVKLTYDVTPDCYELYCLIDNAQFAKVIKERKLPEVFVNFKEGAFDSYRTDLIGSSRPETIGTMLDRAANPGAGSCVFISQKNDRLFGDFKGEGEKPYNDAYLLNHYENTFEFYRDIDFPANKKIWFYNPSYYLTWVIAQVCRFLGFEAKGELMDDPRVRTLIIDNTGFIDVTEMFHVDGTRLAPAKYLPNITIADLFKVLRSTFRLAIVFDGNERKAWFNYAPNIVASPEAVDLSGYVEKQPAIDRYVPTGAMLEQAVDDDDDLFKNFEYVKSYITGDQTDPEKLSKFTATSFMTDTVETRPGYGTTWRVPRKRQVGNGYTLSAANTESHNEDGYSKNEFAFRLLNYRGIRYDSGGYQYYYASSDGKDTNANVEPNALSCWLGGDAGLINTFMKDWLIYWLRTESVELVAHLPGHVLLQLSPLGKIVWTTPTRAMMPALLNQVSFEQSSRYADRIAAKIKCYPIYNQAAADIKAFKEVVIGDIENEGKIYVKFTHDEYRVDQQYIFNMLIVRARYWHGYLEFYSDEACTKPRNVSNIVVVMHYVYRGANERNYTEYDFYVLASGTKHQIQINEEVGIDQVYRNQSSKDFWTKSYSLRPGADYTVVQ